MTSRSSDAALNEDGIMEYENGVIFSEEDLETVVKKSKTSCKGYSTVIGGFVWYLVSNTAFNRSITRSISTVAPFTLPQQLHPTSQTFTAFRSTQFKKFCRQSAYASAWLCQWQVILFEKLIPRSCWALLVCWEFHFCFLVRSAKIFTHGHSFIYLAMDLLAELDTPFQFTMRGFGFQKSQVQQPV